jgi:hypothetical protein
MKKVALLLGMALAVALPAYAADPLKDGKNVASKVAPKGAKSTGTCHQRVCRIAVTASSCQSIDVNPDELKLGGQKEYEVIWTIPAQAGATFRGEGIRFKSEKSASLDALGIKRPLKVAADGKQVSLTIVPKTAGSWYYGVQIKYGGRDCAEYDPVIVNEM